MKRSSTEAAVKAIAEKDVKAEERRAAVVSTIPAPIYQDPIRWDIVDQNRDFNVRDPENYAYEKNKGLFNSLKEFGLQRHGDTMCFSKKADGSLLILVGNLRYAMMKLIRIQEGEQREKSGVETTPENPLPFETIFGLVYSGLTPEQETALMADHILRQGLNQFELAKEIGEFLEKHRLTDAQAATYFGIDKNKVARLRMRYSMPTVFEEFRKEHAKQEGIPYYAVDAETLGHLYTAMLADREGGNKFRQEGPNFRAAWQVFIRNPDAFKKTKKKGQGNGENGSREQSVIGNQANGLTAIIETDGPEIDLLTNALRWAGNINGSDGEGFNLNEIAQQLADYCKSLRDENSNLRAEVEQLRGEITEAKEAVSVMEREYSNLQAEFNSLQETASK